MKNIHVIKTDKASRLHKYDFDGFALSKEALNWKEAKNIYITNDEEIKEGDWGLSKLNEVILFGINYNKNLYKKIILTTNQDLIKDGVQEISDEFLEWFVKNSSCEWVEVQKGFEDGTSYGYNFLDYKIIIPKEEPKQDMEQTAVEWLEFRYKNNITLNQYDFEEAKKIEEENICDAYNEGLYAWDNTDDFIGIDYYNKKFKNK